MNINARLSGRLVKPSNLDGGSLKINLSFKLKGKSAGKSGNPSMTSISLQKRMDNTNNNIII